MSGYILIAAFFLYGICMIVVGVEIAFEWIKKRRPDKLERELYEARIKALQAAIATISRRHSKRDKSGRYER